MKCDYCGKEIEINDMGKIVGTFVWVSGKKYYVLCRKCQSTLFSKYKSKGEVIKEIERKKNVK